MTRLTYINLKIENFCSVHRLGFERKWILTSRPAGFIIHQHVKFEHNPAICGLIIDDLANFPAHIFRSNFVRACF